MMRDLPMDLSRIRTVFIVGSLFVVLSGFAALILAIGVASGTAEQPVLWIGLTDTQFVQWGLGLILGGSLVSLLFVLWKAKTLHRDWLRALAFAFKALGVLLVLLLAFWMASVWQKREIAEQHTRDERARQEGAEASRARKEEARVQRYRDNAERAARFVRELQATSDPAARIALIGVQAANLLDDDFFSLTLAQAIHHVIVHDPIPEVSNYALRQLFPKMDTKPEEESFAKAVIAYTETWITAHPQGNLPESYFRYLTLISANVEDSSITMRADDLRNKLAARSLTAADGNGAKPEATTQVLFALSSSNDKTREDAATKLEKLAPSDGTTAAEDDLRRVIKSLPSAVSRKLPPRVYVRVAKEDVEKAKSKLKDLRTKQFIVRGPTVIAQPPKNTTIIYYAPDRAGDAEVIRDFLKGVEISARLEYRPPRESESRNSDDISSHFELVVAAGVL
jgi:heme exporter protein D